MDTIYDSVWAVICIIEDEYTYNSSVVQLYHSYDDAKARCKIENDNIYRNPNTRYEVGKYFIF